MPSGTVPGYGVCSCSTATSSIRCWRAACRPTGASSSSGNRCWSWPTRWPQPGGGLIVLHDHAEHAIPALAHELDVQAVFVNHDYEPAANARDDAVRQALAAQARVLFSFKDQVVFERDEILTGQGKPFSVFTPYKNAWLRTVQPFDLHPYPIAPYLHALAPVPAAYRKPVPTLGQLGFCASNLAEIAMPAGASGAQALFDEFANRIGDYGRRRDYPALRGPSYLSVHLRRNWRRCRTSTCMRRGPPPSQCWQPRACGWATTTRARWCSMTWRASRRWRVMGR